MKKLLLNTFGFLAVFFTLLAFSSTASAVEKSFTITFKTSSNSGGTDLSKTDQDPIAISVESGTENISKLDDFNKVYAAGLYGLKIGTNSAAGAIGVYFATPVKATKIEVLASASKNATGQKLDIAYKNLFKDPIEFSFNKTEVKDVYKTCVLDLDGNTEVASVYLNKTNNSPEGYISIKSITVYYNDESGTPGKTPTSLKWSAETVEVNKGDEFTAPTLTIEPAGINVAYSSSDETVAKIDAAGAVEIVGAGTTKITASIKGVDGYEDAEASYTLTVVDPTAVPDEYVLTFGSTGNSKGVSSYTSNWKRTCNGKEWDISNFNNNNNDPSWKYIRCGSKKAVSVATITTATVMAYPVNQIDLTIDAITANSVNSIKLLTSTSADFSNRVHSIDVKKTAATHAINIPNPQANLYYRLEFDCKKSSNGIVQVSKVVYKLKKDNKESAKLAYATTTVNKATTDQPFINPLTNEHGVEVVYSSDNEAVATVNSQTGEVTVVGVGKAVISAAFAGNETYSKQTVSYTLNVVALGVNSIEETLALEDQTEVLINYPMTVAFRNGNNVFAVDEAGKFIQIYGSNSYAANDIIPAGWTGKFTWYGATPEIKPVGALPEAVKGGNFIPEAVDPSTVTVGMVNSVVLFKNVVISADTPATQENFKVSVGGNEVSLRNNYALPSVSAGVYDVTVVVNIFNDGPSYNVVAYKAVPAFRINGVLVTDAIFDADGLKIELEAVLPEGHQMWYRFTPVGAASSQAVTDEDGFTKYESAFELEDPGKLEYYSVDPEGNKSEVYELRLDNVTGINDIVVDGDNSEAVYYNLQGVRVDNPNSGIYLVRRAGRVSKVFVK